MYRRLYRSTVERTVEITYDGEEQPLHSAWQALWETLSAICMTRRRVECDEFYDGLSPEAYADALRSAAEVGD
jgi:hypothetical protein